MTSSEGALLLILGDGLLRLGTANRYRRFEEESIFAVTEVNYLKIEKYRAGVIQQCECFYFSTNIIATNTFGSSSIEKREQDCFTQDH